MFQTKAKILKNECIAEGFYKMILKAPKIALQAKPGQFVHVLCGNKSIPLLRRPFSIAEIEYPSLFGSKPTKISLVYKVVGEGTKLLSQYQEGERLDILGPLGKGWDVSKTEGQKVLLIGGGTGIASLLSLAQEFTKPYRSNPKLYILFGERTFNLGNYLIKGIFSRRIRFITEDGSFGAKGVVTDFIDSYYSFPEWKKKEIALKWNYEIETIEDFDMVYACGPWSMLKKVAEITEIFGVSCEVSLESHMACGIGACLGCVIKTKDGYKRVCKDGPVFEAREVSWQ